MDTAEALFGVGGVASLVADVAAYMLPESPISKNAAIATTGLAWTGLYIYIHFLAKEPQNPEGPPQSYRDIEIDDI